MSLQLAVILAQRPEGSRAAELARIARAPHTSVQRELRNLVEHGFVRRDGLRFRIVDDHPASLDLVNLGLRLPAPAAAIALVLRANDAVDIAFFDLIGFVIGERRTVPSAAWQALNRSLATIQRDRDTPAMLRFETPELTRILRSAFGLRTRFARAEPIKGLGADSRKYHPGGPDPGN